MPLTWKDWGQQTVSAGGTGALTLSTASTGYQALASGDNGQLFSYSIRDGSDWETGIGIYTHSGTSFARTTRYSSSTGSALNVTTAALVMFAINSTVAQGMDLASQAITPGGRLTLTTAVPVTTSDVTGATTVYYTPYKHNIIVLWDGNRWQATTFAEASLALGTVTAFSPYDVFAYLSSGALAVEKLAWLNATVTMTIASPGVVTWTAHGMSNGDPVVFTTTGALPTGLTANTQYWVVNKATDTFQVSATQGGSAINTSGSQSGTHTAWQSRQRGTAVTLQDGRYCKSGDKTRLYLGSFYTTATTTTEDSDTKRYVWSSYNRQPRRIKKSDATSHSYNGGYRQWNNSTANQVNFFLGLAEDAICASVYGQGSASGSSVYNITSLALDATSAIGNTSGFIQGLTTEIGTTATETFSPSAGMHYIAVIEGTVSTGNSTFGKYYLTGSILA